MQEVTRHDVAAVVVLYRPGATVQDNISAFATQVDRVFAIDNSEQPDPVFVASLRTFLNLEYVSLGDNMGVAAALNAGVERARDAGYSWVLTMDQDSTATPGMVDLLLTCLEGPQGRAGIVAATPLQEGAPVTPEANGCAEETLAMTSGNLLSVQAFVSAGRFMDGLFIDQVDNEYCMRLRSRGFTILRSRDATFTHRLGDVRHHRFPLAAYVTNHPPVRRYYITRNRFAVARMYRRDFPEYSRHEMRSMVKEVVKILLYETSKLEKYRMMLRGYHDYRRGRMGRLEERNG